MSAPRPIDAYIRAALEQGRSHDEIRASLAAAGWPGRDVEDALSAWADTGTVPPVPRPQAQFSVLDLFLYLLLLAALAASAFYTIALAWGVVDLAFPDPLRAGRGRAESLRWAMAILIVSAPVYGALVRWADRDVRAHPYKRGAPVRRGALGLMLLIAAAVFLGDAAVLVYRFLNGDLTEPFVLKALAVALVAGAVMVVGRLDLAEATAGGGPRKRAILASAAAAIVALIGASLLLTELPAGARQTRLDAQRLADLVQGAEALRCPNEGEVLPAALDRATLLDYCRGRTLAALPPDRGDPVTGAPYRYDRLDDARFRICADFADPAALARRPPATGLPRTTGRNWLFDPETGCVLGRIR